MGNNKSSRSKTTSTKQTNGNNVNNNNITPTPNGNTTSFSRHGSYIKLSGDHKQTMTVIKRSRKAKSNRQQHSAYTKESHKSDETQHIKYKITINSQSGVIGIGLTTNDKIKKDCFSELCINDGSFYSYWNNGEKITNNPHGTYKRYQSGYPKFGTDDIIYVTLDLSSDNCIIKFERITSNEEGKADIIEFDNISVGDGIEYKLCISAERNGDSVTIERV